tara:strand:- start:4829 stop:4981 length:153 start_codon:yes stop_codon:yes gene_type:complete
MKQLQHLLANCPPYLLALVSFGSVVSYGLVKLYGLLQTVGLGAGVLPGQI